MDTIFMNCRNSKTSDPDRLLLNLLNKTNLTGSNKYVSLYCTWKNIKKSNKKSAPT